MVELGEPTYQFIELRSMKELREIFPHGVADKRNWVFLSQKCFHGTDETLDYAEKILLGQGEAQPIDGKYWQITVLVMHPRLTTIKYGYIYIQLEDVEYLRNLVRTTLEAIKESQKGNL